MSGGGFEIGGRTPEPTSSTVVPFTDYKLPQELLHVLFPTENNSNFLLEELNPAARTWNDFGSQGFEDNPIDIEWPCPSNSLGTPDLISDLQIASALVAAGANVQEDRVLQELNPTSSDFNTHNLDLQSTVSQITPEWSHNLEDSRAPSSRDTNNDQRSLAVVIPSDDQQRDTRSESSEKKRRNRKSQTKRTRESERGLASSDPKKLKNILRLRKYRGDKKEELRCLKEEIRWLREKCGSCVCGSESSAAALQNFFFLNS